MPLFKFEHRHKIDSVDLKPLLDYLATIEELLKELKREVTKMAGELEALQAEVSSNTTVVASAIALIEGLAAKISANITDPAALQLLVDSLNENNAALAAAVEANTPVSQ